MGLPVQASCEPLSTAVVVAPGTRAIAVGSSRLRAPILCAPVRKRRRLRSTVPA